MSDTVVTRVSEGVATITIANPPVNALSAPVRAALVGQLSAAIADAGVAVIVLAAAGRTWPAGADIREFGKSATPPLLSNLCDMVAASPKPVIAALHGTALGGGLALALAAQYRVAAPGTQLGLPEVALGLVPGAGGTQRLPRLIGARAALGMMLSGLPVQAERGIGLGLIDRLISGDPAAAANALAQALIKGGADLPPLPRSNAARAEPEIFPAAVAAARAGLAGPGLPAPGRIVDCVEAALLLPEAEGFAFERSAFDDLVLTPQAAALRHAFLAERRAMRPRPLVGVLPRKIENLAVVGAGVQGSLLVSALLSAGFRVNFIDRNAEVLAAGLSRVASAHEMAVASGRLLPAAREAEWDRVTGATNLVGLVGCDLVLAATGTDLSVCAAAFAELDAASRPSTILVSTGRAVDLEALAAATSRPDDVAAVFFPRPAEGQNLLEVAAGSRTAPAVTATCFTLARKLGRLAVLSGSGPAPMGDRLFAAYRRVCDSLLERGASPYDIDRGLVAYGFPIGLYRWFDRAGLTTTGVAASDIGQRLIRAGRLGQKVGRGFYRYGDASRQGAEDPEVLALVAALRQDKGVVARRVAEAEIQDRVVAALANEGARMLEVGACYCPADIDLVMMAVHSYPRWRGGPMQTADASGLLQIRNRLGDYAREDAGFWSASGLWDDLIKNGLKFADLNTG